MTSNVLIDPAKKENQRFELETKAETNFSAALISHFGRKQQMKFIC